MSWDNGFNTEGGDGDITSEDVTEILNSIIFCNNDTFSFIDFDIENDTGDNPYITIIFNGDTATAYIATAPLGTSETYYATTKTN